MRSFSLTVPKVTLGFIESFKGNNKTWHMSFHYKAEPDKRPQFKSSDDLKSTEWFYLDQLPERSEVAHHRWALTTLREIAKH